MYIDLGLDQCRSFFASCIFESFEIDLKDRWLHPPLDPLQIGYTDRDLIKDNSLLQKYTIFEDTIGITFNHIKLLVR